MPSALPTHILVEQAKQGDKAAFETLFEDTHVRIFNFLLAEGLNKDEADDVCQETYVRAWRHLKGLRVSSSFLVWLHQIARNASKDYMKGRARRPEAPAEAVEQEADPRQPDPLALAEGQALAVAVKSGIAALPENQRLPIVMRHLEGMSVAQISEGLKLPYGTVLSRLARGRAALARRLAPFVNLSDTAKGNANVVQD
ncbi:MAG: RNA polymerase sigma factor [Armatimonadetes bacterium]|nr:RNA polymerase sigma factor [Armatimonadota bacterium]